MGIMDKITGRAKKAAGDVADDASLRQQGRKEEAKGDAKESAAAQAGERRRRKGARGQARARDLSASCGRPSRPLSTTSKSEPRTRLRLERSSLFHPFDGAPDTYQADPLSATSAP